MPVQPLGFSNRLARGAVFMSGTGANAETILNRLKTTSSAPWTPACIVTDRPESSRSRELADKFSLPLVSHDIRAFYQQHGRKTQSLATEEGWRIRDLWTEALRSQLQPYNIDFGVLAGFLALSNITADFPCLNVHPGDLTYKRDGKRYLVGHHTIPIERAILENLQSLRTSIIIAQPISGSDDMDSGPILGISPEVPTELAAHSVSDLAAIANNRPKKRPRGGWNDALQNIADLNLSRLKTNGDLITFPPVIDAFVAGHYGLDTTTDTLQWRYAPSSTDWLAVKTVAFNPNGDPTPITI